VLRRRENRGQLVGVGLDQAGHRDRDLPLLRKQPLSVDDREPDDLTLLVKPHRVALRCAERVRPLTLLAATQIQDVPITVVGDVIELVGANDSESYA
jgi:hypothetical protein